MAGKEKDYFISLYDVAKVINASLSPSQVLEKIVTSVAAAIQVKACTLRVLEARKKRLVMGAHCGLSDGYIRKGPIWVGESGLDQKALQGKTVWMKNAQVDKDFQYNERARLEGITSVLVVPLMVEKEVIGVLRVYSEEEREFDEDEKKFLEAAANLSAIALENARLHHALQKDYDLLVAHKYRLDDN
ncbi:MAG: GAF domain-containing protein [Thermodesulfobacteriota bacterium]